MDNQMSPVSVADAESILKAAKEKDRSTQFFSRLLADTLALKRFEGKGEVDVFIAAYGGPYGAEEYAKSTRYSSHCVREFCIAALNRNEEKEVFRNRDLALITRFPLLPPA